ncbi:MAG: hypothetical protein QOC62_1991 [Mycobacterium sp.]|jgi:hypothetical protein|nr:hypothetical protein [Mycobacterium sp.]
MKAALSKGRAAVLMRRRLTAPGREDIGLTVEDVPKIKVALEAADKAF